MASAQATAERYTASLHGINAAMSSLSAKHNIPIPPPAPKAETSDAKAAGELDRVARFMTQLAGMADPAGYTPGMPVPGSIQDGYIDTRDNPENKAKGKDRIASAPGPTGPVDNGGAADAGEEELYGRGDERYPLSHFDGMTDEQIVAVPGIGEATLHDIRKAQKKAAK